MSKKERIILPYSTADTGDLTAGIRGQSLTAESHDITLVKSNTWTRVLSLDMLSGTWRVEAGVSFQADTTPRFVRCALSTSACLNIAGEDGIIGEYTPFFASGPGNLSGARMGIDFLKLAEDAPIYFWVYSTAVSGVTEQITNLGASRK